MISFYREGKAKHFEKFLVLNFFLKLLASFASLR